MVISGLSALNPFNNLLEEFKIKSIKLISNLSPMETMIVILKSNCWLRIYHKLPQSINIANI